MENRDERRIITSRIALVLILVLVVIFVGLSIYNINTNKTEEISGEESGIDTAVLEEQMENTQDAQVEQIVELEVEKPKYTEDDLFCLAAAVCREAGGENEDIQMLVANVVLNRVNSPHYPDSIRGVLTQRKQYGMMWKNGISFPSWAKEKTIDQCYSVAKKILEGERVCPENVIYQAEFKQGDGVYKEYPGFYFCYKN